MMYLKNNQKKYDEVIKYGEEALKIKKNEKTYINEVFSYNETIYDLLSLAYYYSGNIDKALENIDIALSINSTDERLINNKKIFLKEKNQF